jgi:hypothetical protein
MGTPRHFEDPMMDTSGHAAEIERLERAFWQSLVDGEPKVASAMLTGTALMVGPHGAMSFDPPAYEKMAADPKSRVLDYRFSDFDVLFPREDVAIATYKAWQQFTRKGETIEQDVVDSSTWVRLDGAWKCASHTESLVPATPPAPAH